MRDSKPTTKGYFDIKLAALIAVKSNLIDTQEKLIAICNYSRDDIHNNTGLLSTLTEFIAAVNTEINDCENMIDLFGNLIEPDQIDASESTCIQGDKLCVCNKCKAGSWEDYYEAKKNFNRV